MRSHLKYRKTSVLLWLLLALATYSCLLKRIDDTPYHKTAAYKETVRQLYEHQPTVTSADTVQVGWAKVNITPAAPAPLAGYGKRMGLEYTQVHDSVWVRTFAFDNGTSKAVLVALDMLITPMSVAAELEKEYPALGLKPEQVYLSATHTHTSFGGWGEKLAGRLMAGKYDEELVNQTVARIVESIKLAQKNLAPAKIGFGSTNATRIVHNRLTGSKSDLDTKLRYIKMMKQNGETAIFCSFSAHPTILSSEQPILSRDYPGELVDDLEQQVDFAAFSAGAVASHSTVEPFGSTFKSTDSVGTTLAEAILRTHNRVSLQYYTSLGSSRVPLKLPKPTWRLGENRKLPPALFYTFFGKYPSHLTSLQIGNIILLGVPADYSGEFLPELEQQAQAQGQQLLVTGFNGGYIGYVIPDKHYELKKYEARDMNFYGPYGGSYLTEMLQRLLKQHSGKNERAEL